MTWPLAILAAWTLMLSVLCTPFWPLLEHHLAGSGSESHAGPAGTGLWGLLIVSALASCGGIAVGWRVYRRIRTSSATEDPLEARFPALHGVLSRAYGVDALYAATVTRAGWMLGQAAAWLERWLWEGLVDLVQTLGQLGGWTGSRLDEQALNESFDAACDITRSTGRSVSRFHNGRAHRYLRLVAMGSAVLALFLFWIA